MEYFSTIKWPTDAHKMNEPQNNYAEWKEPDTPKKKEYTVCHLYKAPDNAN